MKLMTFEQAAPVLATGGRVARLAWPEPKRWLAGAPGAFFGPGEGGHVGPQPDPAGDDATAADWYEMI